MKPNHHPDSSTLISYSAGSLPEPLATVIACHITACKSCRKKIHEAEQIGSTLLDNVTPTPVSSTVKQALLNKLDALETIKEEQKKTVVRSIDIPQPLNAVLGSSLQALNWKAIVPGIKQLVISSSDQGQLRLLKIAPGTCMPAHSHNGSELTLVLKGSYTDETGRYQAGDMADLGPDIQHQPVADTGEECICLIATDAPLRFVNWVPRLLQPFFGL